MTPVMMMVMMMMMMTMIFDGDDMSVLKSVITTVILTKQDCRFNDG